MNNLKPIVGVGNTGDALRNTQERATKEGFDHVNKSWYDKTLSYDQTLEQLEKGVAEREDIVCPMKELSIVLDGEAIKFKHQDGRLFNPTDHALRQFATRADMPHTFVNWAQKNETLKQNGDTRWKFTKEDKEAFVSVYKCMHRHLTEEGDKQFRFRTYKDGTLRAVLTQQYAPIDNRWYLERLKAIIPGGRVSHFNFSTADTVAFNVLIPDTIREEEDSDYGGMVSCRNCEIGLREFVQNPALMRHICWNGTIWDMTKGTAHSRRHRGKIDLVQLEKQLRANIELQIPLLKDGIVRFLGLRKWGWDGASNGDHMMAKLVAKVVLDNQLTTVHAKETITQYAAHERANKSAFGLVNSFTRAGQTFDATIWDKCDRLAGRIMQGGEKGWEKLVDGASRLEPEELEAVYGEK